jgi:hypothetical protein
MEGVMGFFEGFGKTRSAGRYFNEANKYWTSAEQPFKAKDELTLAHNLIEVIKKCQLALAEDDNYGDAYVLLADALLLAGVSEPIMADKERSWYLVTRAAAVIYTWYTLPNRNYPITKNVRQGEKVFQSILGIVNAGELEADKYPMKLMNNYREQYANSAISPEGLEEISDVLLNRSHMKDEEHTPTSNHTSNSAQWLEETLIPAHCDFLAKVIHRLSNASSPPQLDQQAARLDRIREMTEDLQDPSRILSTTEEILNRIKDAYEQKDWRQMLGWLADIRFINDYRRSKSGYDKDTMKKLDMSWAEFFAPTINEVRRAKDIDTMLLAIGYNHYLGIDEVATKLLKEVRNEVSGRDIMSRMQNISENPIMMHEEATINKTREFIDAN